MNPDLKSKMIDKLSSKNSGPILFWLMIPAIILLPKVFDGWLLFAVILASLFTSAFVAVFVKTNVKEKYEEIPNELIKHEYEELIEEEKSKKQRSQLTTWGIAALAVALFSTNPSAASFSSYIKTSKNSDLFKYERINFFLISLYKFEPSENDIVYLGILNTFIDLSWMNDKLQDQ
jgi:hypothetical protein